MDKVAKFRILIRLALVDECLDQSEKEFLFKLAALEELSKNEIEKLVEEVRKSSEEPYVELGLSYDEKIKVLTDLIRVMKVDGKVFDAEVKFCERVAKGFGFSEKAIGFLTGNININPRDTTELSKVQHRMKKYLIY